MMWGRLLFPHLRPRRFFTKKPLDPKHIFTDPQTNGIRSPPKYFQERSNVKGSEPDEISASGQESLSTVIGESILQQKRRRQRIKWAAILFGVFGSLVGYTVGYKVLYKKEESFIPLWPAKRSRPLSTKDAAMLHMAEIKRLAEYKVLEKLSMHDTIKEQYGVPLRTYDGKTPESRIFEVWCEDLDPCITGIVLRPYEQKEPSDYQWRSIPYVLQWRVGYRPISIHSAIDSVMGFIGLGTSDLFQVINPNKVYGDFKYEFPSPRHTELDHAIHIWFLGEISLSPDSLIVYKGRYNITAKIEEICLLRKEEDKLVRYVLYRSGNI